LKSLTQLLRFYVGIGSSRADTAAGVDSSIEQAQGLSQLAHSKVTSL